MNDEYYAAHTRRVTVNRTTLLHQWRVSYTLAGTPYNDYFPTWRQAIRHATTIAGRRPR